VAGLNPEKEKKGKTKKGTLALYSSISENEASKLNPSLLIL
jgi:hypothetical protein